mgnify:CR=1 FL=1
MLHGDLAPSDSMYYQDDKFFDHFYSNTAKSIYLAMMLRRTDHVAGMVWVPRKAYDCDCLIQVIHNPIKENNLQFDELCGTLAKRAGVPIKVYLDPSGKKADVYVPDSKISEYDVTEFCVSILPKLLPAYFKDDPLREDERKVISAWWDKDKEEFIRAANALYEAPDVRERVIRINCGKFQARMIEQSIYENENSYKDALNRLNLILLEYRQQKIEIDNIRKEKVEAMERLHNLGNHDDELLDLLVHNPKIRVVRSEKYGIKFIVSGKLTNFDDMLYNPSAYFGEKDQDMKKLFDFILCREPVFQIYTKAKFEIVNGGFRAIQGAFNKEGEDFIPNPHLDGFACFGEADKTLNDLLLAGDIAGMVCQCVAQTSVLNVCDPYPMRKLIQGMSKCGKALYNTQTHTDCTVSEAMEYLHI